MNRMLRIFVSRATAATLVVSGCLSLSASSAAAATGCGAHPWCNVRLAPGQRAAKVLGSMTTAEKLALVSNGSAGNARLGIPALRGIDGPNGVGEGNTHVTAFPDAETIAASWDPGVAGAYGRALGAEAAWKGFDWLFAPTINDHLLPGRSPPPNSPRDQRFSGF